MLQKCAYYRRDQWDCRVLAHDRPTCRPSPSCICCCPPLSAAHEKQGLQAVKMTYYINLPYFYTLPCQPTVISQPCYYLWYWILGTIVQPHTPDPPPSLMIFSLFFLLTFLFIKDERWSDPPAAQQARSSPSLSVQAAGKQYLHVDDRKSSNRKINNNYLYRPITISHTLPFITLTTTFVFIVTFLIP
jgi:hypothetical protein